MKRVVPTDAGEIWLYADAWDDADPRPIVLAISGAFAPEDAFDRLQRALPEAFVVRSHLPGNHCPPLRDWQPPTFVRAFGSAIHALRGPVTLCGSSLAGVLGLALTTRNLAGVLALDPPIDTRACDELLAALEGRRAASPGNRHLAEFLDMFFGVLPGRTVLRDHRLLIPEIGPPATVVAPQTGSFLSPTARDAIATVARIDTVISPTAGHNLVWDNPTLILSEIRKLLPRLSI